MLEKNTSIGTVTISLDVVSTVTGGLNLDVVLLEWRVKN